MNETSAARHHDPGCYEIRVKGHLDSTWTEWLRGSSLTNVNDGTAIISGIVVDQAGLHGLLQRLRDLGLALVSLTSTDLEQSSASGDTPRRNSTTL